MKTTKTNQFHKLWLVLCFMVLSVTGYSQIGVPIHWTGTVELCAQVAPNQLEFNVYLQFDGTSSVIELAGYSFGVNYTSTILNGGTASFTQVIARDVS